MTDSNGAKHGVSIAPALAMAFTFALKSALLALAVAAFFETAIIGMNRLNYSSPLPYGIRSLSDNRIDQVSLKPGFSGVSGMGIEYRINSLGLRDDEPEPGARSFVFLGDSVTFGLNLKHEDTFEEVFERLANGGGKHEQAFNAGTPGQGTFDEVDWLKKAIATPGVNVGGVILGFTSGDFVDNWQYLAYKETRETYKNNRFQRFKFWLSDHFDTYRRLSGYFQLARNKLTEKIREKREMLANGGAPVTASAQTRASQKEKGASGEATAEEIETGRALKLDLLTDEQILSNRIYGETLKAIDEISALCHARGIPFIFLRFPGGEREIFEKSPRYVALLKKHVEKLEGAHYIEVKELYVDYLSANGYGKSFPPNFRTIDEGDLGHPGPVASRLIGEEIYRTLKNRNGL